MSRTNVYSTFDYRGILWHAVVRRQIDGLHYKYGRAHGRYLLSTCIWAWAKSFFVKVELPF